MVAEPIKKIITDLLIYLKGKNERDWLLGRFQLNSGLRISDVVGIKVSEILNEKENFK